MGSRTSASRGGICPKTFVDEDIHHPLESIASLSRRGRAFTRRHRHLLEQEPVRNRQSFPRIVRRCRRLVLLQELTEGPELRVELRDRSVITVVI
jgi:hypothetical protein